MSVCLLHYMKLQYPSEIRDLFVFGKEEKQKNVKKLHIHLKFLTSSYLTNDRLALDQLDRSHTCSLCSGLNLLEHLILSCIVELQIMSEPDSVLQCCC